MQIYKETALVVHQLAVFYKVLRFCASLLGGAQELNNVDLNDYTTTGVYYFKTGCTNNPAEYLHCVVYKTGQDVFQLGVSYVGNVSSMYLRRKRSQEGWDEWQRIDNFGTSSLSELATALGVPNKLFYTMNKDGMGMIFRDTNFLGFILAYATDFTEASVYFVYHASGSSDYTNIRLDSGTVCQIGNNAVGTYYVSNETTGKEYMFATIELTYQS